MKQYVIINYIILCYCIYVIFSNISIFHKLYSHLVLLYISQVNLIEQFCA